MLIDRPPPLHPVGVGGPNLPIFLKIGIFFHKLTLESAKVFSEHLEVN